MFERVARQIGKRPCRTMREVSMPSLEELLLRTSRTFAVAIPLLPEPTCAAVRIAYLLFRIADTFEDAAGFVRTDRLAALADFEVLLEAPSLESAGAFAAKWTQGRLSPNEGYVELVAQSVDVFAALAALEPVARAIVIGHARRTTRGMADVVRRSDAEGRLEFTTVQELRDYCYVVAGIVGELLTDLFVEATPSLAAVRADLDAEQVIFGEGLQLVNILKDEDDDARDGRRYLPRTSHEEVFALARADLDRAERYVRNLARGGAPRGVVVFTALPLLLAGASLERVKTAGPGAKVGRPLVMAVLQHVQEVPLDSEAAAMLAFVAPPISIG